MAIIDKLAVAALAQPEQGQTAIPMPKHWASSDPDGHRQAYADARADAEHSSRAREQGLGVDKTDEWEARQDADKQPGLFYYKEAPPAPERGLVERMKVAAVKVSGYPDCFNETFTEAMTDTAKAQVPEGRYRKNCHICGCLLTDGKCLSCGHEQCDECPVHVPKPSYEELEAECRRLREEAESGDEMYEALQVKFEGCPHHHDSPCACSYDAPGDVCSVHSPALRKAEAENAKLREALRPVTVTEFREYAHKDDWGVDCVYIGGCNELLSARAQKAGL
jgi:hypothetical protein